MSNSKELIAKKSRQEATSLNAQKRRGIGTLVSVQVALILIAFLAINRISYRYHKRWDLSPHNHYTLTSATQVFLEKLSKDVVIYNLFARDSKIFSDVSNLLEEYRIHGANRIKVRSIDPLRDIERAQELQSKIKISMDQNGIVLEANDKYRFLKEDELVIYEQSTETVRLIRDFRGEDAVTSALLNLIEGEEKQFHFIMGKGASSDKLLIDSMISLSDIGKQQNYQLQPLNMADVQEIPLKTDGLILFGFRYDLSEREIELLKKYWKKSNSGILVFLDPNAQTPRLYEFLKQNGIMVQDDRVLYAQSTGTGIKKEFSVQTYFNYESPITQRLSSSTSQFNGQTQSLKVLDNKELNEEYEVVIKPIITASERYWGEKQYLDELPVMGEGDSKPPLTVAVSVEKGVITDESLRTNSSRMVVVGNASLMDGQAATAINRDFITASLNWLMNRERMIGITPKPKHMYRIELSQQQHEIIFTLTFFLIPGLILVIGLLVWSNRRAA
jgi:ABC-type uncharacterized transport system involved in gliding motility auxiliary subunit